MATNDAGSPSPQAMNRVFPKAFDGYLTTPVYSPYSSDTSPASSPSTLTRTPAHALTLYEYRKQQNASILTEQTPLHRRIRRKTAVRNLASVERAPQPANALRSVGSRSSVSTVDSIDEVRDFSIGQRPPLLSTATAPEVGSSPPKNKRSTQYSSANSPASLHFSLGNQYSSEAQTTPTHSTFSLSQFPKPPHQIGPQFSPLYHDLGGSNVNSLNCSTNPPATPPATPATIYYCGASFDLVNPHNSLLLHDIVTPSWQFDSSENLLSQKSEDFFTETAEMAHKRPLYSDINSARAGIMRQPGDTPEELGLEVPLYPAPTVISPNSSAYISPINSPESVHVPSPLAVRKPANDARFSLKQLTRSLTKKIIKSPEKDNEEELQEFSQGFASVDSEEKLQQPQQMPYVMPPQASYFPPHVSSSITATSPEVYRAFGVEYHAMSPIDRDAQNSQSHTYTEESPVSLAIDDPSTQVGRMEDSQALLQEDNALAKPYYDDLDSIYPSSSIYTGEGHRQSYYQESLLENRQGNPYVQHRSLDTERMAREYNRGSMSGFSSNQRKSYQPSRLSTQELYHTSVDQGYPKTDTISRILDEYSPTSLTSDPSQTGPDHSVVPFKESIAKSSALNDSQLVNQHLHGESFSDDSQSEFDPDQFAEISHDSSLIRVGSVQKKLPNITRDVGLPPCQALPFAPAFEYDEAPFIPPRADKSGMFSNNSADSYEDTQNLLQMCQSDATLQQVPSRFLEPSSSYSQPEASMMNEPSSSYSQQAPQSCQTPIQAMEHTPSIFQEVIAAHKYKEEEIPAMWARRSSGGQLLNKKNLNRRSAISHNSDSGPMRGSEDAAIERADWETVGGNSQGESESLDSLADYSSSESTRNSLEHNAGVQSPVFDTSQTRGLSRYRHQNRLTNQQPSSFTTSPRTAPALSASPPTSSRPGAKTAPLFHFSSMHGQILGKGAVEEPYAFTPWAVPYALSDKETQELLASGPNDNIIIENDNANQKPRSSLTGQDSRRQGQATSSPFESSPANSAGLERVNTFEKYSVVGPLGNLTGTPHGTRMQNTGSSIADNSSPGLKLSSMVGRNSARNERSERNEYVGFYATPFPAEGSVTSISQPQRNNEVNDERAPSQMTLFPNDDEISPVQDSPSQLSTARDRRQPLRSSTTFHRARRASRPAVPGQTKLRQMYLAGDARAATPMSQSTTFSRLMAASDRPSTSDTNTPLFPGHVNMDNFPTTTRTRFADERCPRLLCPERQPSAEDEARRRKLSWALLAMFCLFPPCIILFRFVGDDFMIWATKGRLGYATARSKRVAVIAGIAVNLGLVIVILGSVLIAVALKAV